MSNKPLLTVTFALERETKGAYRYAEAVAEGAEALMGTIYVRKAALQGPAPARLTVTLSAASS